MTDVARSHFVLKTSQPTRDDLSNFIQHVFESIFFEIIRRPNLNKPVIVGVIYSPNTQPRANFDLSINYILEIQGKISNESKLAFNERL